MRATFNGKEGEGSGSLSRQLSVATTGHNMKTEQPRGSLLHVPVVSSIE